MCIAKNMGTDVVGTADINKVLIKFVIGLEFKINKITIKQIIEIIEIANNFCLSIIYFIICLIYSRESHFEKLH